MDLQRIKALNEFWQKAFDRKHPKRALRRRLRDGELKPILVDGQRRLFGLRRPVKRPSGGL